MPADRVFAYDHPHRLTACYHDFVPSSASTPFLTLVRLHGTYYQQKTFARNLTSLTFENVLKLTILILCLTFYNCIILLVMQWPSCNGRNRNAVSMSTRPHYFYCPSPDFTTSIVSQSVTNNRCAPSCGGHKRKVRWHIKKNSAPPPLANCFRRHCAVIYERSTKTCSEPGSDATGFH